MCQKATSSFAFLNRTEAGFRSEFSLALSPQLREEIFFRFVSIVQSPAKGELSQERFCCGNIWISYSPKAMEERVNTESSTCVADFGLFFLIIILIPFTW